MVQRKKRTGSMIKYNTTFIKIFIILSLLVSSGIAEDISINASVSSANITLNDIVSYTVEIQGSSKVSHLPSPQGKNFSIVNGPFESSNIQIINSKMETKKSFTWQLQPDAEGKMVINGFSVLVKKKKYDVSQITVNVGKPRYSSSQTRNQGDSKNKNQGQQVEFSSKIFLDAIPSKEIIYLGEQVIVEYRLIYSMQINNYGTEKTPQAKGFWIEEFPEIRNPKSTKIIIDGVEYMSAVIKRIAMFPTSTGELKIDPFIVQCEVIIPQKKKKRTGFDSFFDDPFFGSSIYNRTSVKRVVSQPMSITVKPLPQSSVTDGTPCVMENLKIVGEVDTMEIIRNKALTLKYKLNGIGNINAVELPKLELPSHVEVFPPKVNKQVNNRGAKINGVAVNEYVLIPHKAGNLQIPAISMTYFDSKLEKYKTVKSRQFNIKVKEDTNQITVNSGLNKEEIILLDKDIQYILKGNVKWTDAGSIFYKKKQFLLINFGSLAFLILGLGMKIYKSALGNDPVYMRKSKAMKIARDKLELGKNAMENYFIPEAMSHFDSTISGFIADRMNLPEAGLGPLDFKHELENHKLDNEIVKQSFEFLENMELMKFSPEAMGKKDMTEMEKICARILTQLSKVI